ncbi:MAG: SDR family oxidoreductase, partial [Anaerolineales bacterium]|nr:SDR family oxidoreductase [Anaerolineales bacterium]
MKVLFIGGTGFISTAVSRLALARGIELYHLNRGQRASDLAGVHQITADAHDLAAARTALVDQTFDVVVDWIAFTPADIERDLALFSGRVGQFVFISSASAYQKPPLHHLITESTPLVNPHWEYSRNKIACELRLEQAYRETGFPVTIVRPSLTYDPVFPIAIGGWGCFTLADRIRRGAPIIVHGDGSSLWVVTHADDFAKGFLGLLGHAQAIGHAFHITTDEVLTWNQIYTQIGEALGAEPKIVHIATDFIARVAPALAGGLLGDKAWSVVFDNTKIKTFVPGYQATLPFRQGIRRTVAWFEADPRRMRIDA